MRCHSQFRWLATNEWMFIANRRMSEHYQLMKITTIGRATVGGTLGRLWTSAGHEVTTFGRAGGDASKADVVLLAVPNLAVPAALDGVIGLKDKIIIDATNRLDGEDPPMGYDSLAEYVKATTGGTVAKAFNLNYGDLYERAAAASRPPSNIWVGDDGARAAVEQLSRDIGMRAVYAGPLSLAAAQESFGYLLNGMVADLGGLVFYQFAPADDF
jgi:predicted dinucleotide-binding enzyme